MSMNQYYIARSRMSRTSGRQNMGFVSGPYGSEEQAKQILISAVVYGAPGVARGDILMVLKLMRSERASR